MTQERNELGNILGKAFIKHNKGLESQLQLCRDRGYHRLSEELSTEKPIGKCYDCTRKVSRVLGLPYKVEPKN
jgi:hypothetical protein